MKLMYAIFCFLMSMVGYTIHGSIFWSIIDFLLTPLVLIKWIIYEEITLSVIQETFSWFFN